jgi:chromosome segregation ATPase
LLPRRITRDDDHPAFTDSERNLILAAETLRSGHELKLRKPDEKPEEKLSLFWRVFGGTLLSICALVVITAYQQLTGGIHDLRNDVARLREANADFLKKDDYNNRSTQMWNRVNELNSLNASVSVLTNKMTGVEQQLAAADRDRKDMQGPLALVAALKEKLTALEEQRRVSEQDHKDLAAMAATIAALKDRDDALAKQLKDADTERRDMARELQNLRERLAKLEGQAEAKPSAEKPTAKLAIPPVP